MQRTLLLLLAVPLCAEPRPRVYITESAPDFGPVHFRQNHGTYRAYEFGEY